MSNVVLGGTPFLTAYDARKLQLRRKRLLKSVFDKILKEISNHVTSAIKRNYDAKSICHTIPMRMLGFPIYDPIDAREYCKRKLERTGYKVSWPENTKYVIIVSWK